MRCLPASCLPAAIASGTVLHMRTILPVVLLNDPVDITKIMGVAFAIVGVWFVTQTNLRPGKPPTSHDRDNHRHIACRPLRPT